METESKGPAVTRAFAYCRVSTVNQVDGDGFERQRAAVDAYASANGLKIARYFEERGVSGTKDWEERPAWVEMIAAITPHTKTIIIERLDRLARDLGVQEYIIRDLRKRNVTLISTAEHDLDSSDPTRVLFRQIIGAVAAYERSMIVAKTRAARDRIRKKTGKCEGRTFFGHDDRRPNEKLVLEKMMLWHAEGYNHSEIRDKLNSAGISTRDGAEKWFPATVSRIIRREKTFRS